MKETESKQSKKLEENGKSGTEAAKKLQDLRLVGCCGDPIFTPQRTREGKVLYV